MSLSDQLQSALAQLKSVDFWLFVVSFIVSGFTLQGLGSIYRQAIALVVILAVASRHFYRVKNWEELDAKGYRLEGRVVCGRYSVVCRLRHMQFFRHICHTKGNRTHGFVHGAGVNGTI